MGTLSPCFTAMPADIGQQDDGTHDGMGESDGMDEGMDEGDLPMLDSLWGTGALESLDTCLGAGVEVSEAVKSSVGQGGMAGPPSGTGECGPDACGGSQEAADAPAAAQVAEAQEDDSRHQRRPRSCCTLLITAKGAPEAGAPDAQWSEATGQ